MNRIAIFLMTLIALATSIHTSSIDYVIIEGNKTLNEIKTSQLKIKRTKSRVSYYANSDATFNIILSGDIGRNPGPAPKCTECNKGVGTNRKRLKCDKCLCLTHASCSSLSKSEQTRMTSRIVVKWTCKECTLSTLPFFGLRDIDLNDSSLDEELIIENTHRNLLNENRNLTSIVHINTQSLPSSFTEFSTMLNLLEFDIITLSETWLQDNKDQEDYAQIPGYTPSFKHRKTRGGGVGIYAKELLHFEPRYDLTKNSSMEILAVEFRGRNKNTPYLLVTVYQPSFQENEKLLWLDLFETPISEISTKWNGVIILTGDMNIDLLGQEKESTKRYKDILNSYNLYQHVTKPTRKGKTLIDHLITNIPNKVNHNDVLPTDKISDHDTPYILVNIKKERFEPRYKFIRDDKNLDMNSYINDISSLPLNTVYAFDDPEDQIDILNHLILQCIENHAPLKRVKLTHPVAP